MPAALADDWLNLFLLQRGNQEKCDDFRFVYLGPKGSNTALHVDVLGSYSWSTNIAGRKHWCFYDPLGPAGAPPIAELDQEAGETVFVPSGWPHTVTNTRDTISINHNWGNAFNIVAMATVLVGDLLQVRRDLFDLAATMEGWLAQCDALVKANSGLSCGECVTMIALGVLFAASRCCLGRSATLAPLLHRHFDTWRVAVPEFAQQSVIMCGCDAACTGTNSCFVGDSRPQEAHLVRLDPAAACPTATLSCAALLCVQWSRAREALLVLAAALHGPGCPSRPELRQHSTDASTSTSGSQVCACSCPAPAAAGDGCDSIDWLSPHTAVGIARSIEELHEALKTATARASSASGHGDPL